MKLVLEVKEIHIHIHKGDEEALAKLKELTKQVDADKVSMQTVVDENKGTTQ